MLWSMWVAWSITGCSGDVILKETDDTPAETDVPPAPDIAVSPASLSFGTLPPDCASERVPIEISNVGTAALSLLDVSLDGADRSAYSLSDVFDSLGPGESTEVYVTFEPGDELAYDQARVVIESNDPDEATVRVGLEGEGGDEGIVEDVFIQEQSDGVDVLFVLDTSGSMDGDIEDLGVHFSTFINTFVNLGLDFHLAILPIDEDCPTFVGPVITNQTPDVIGEFTRQVGLNMCNDNETTFDTVTKALTPPQLTGDNAGFLRTDANLAVVVFTDEPEQSGEFLSRPSPASFVNFLASLKGGDTSKISFSGLVGPETAVEAANCLLRANPALPDARYPNAIRRSNGYHGRICNVRVQPFLRLLAKQASGVNFTFDLSSTPTSTDPADWEVELGGVFVPNGATDGWTYDPQNRQIVLDGTAVPAPGEALSVRYPAEITCP